jgi:hypothetical protein
MELNTEHRKALISELEKAKQDLKIQKRVLESNALEDLSKWCEISIFLAIERINLIEQSIINNEIDY